MANVGDPLCSGTFLLLGKVLTLSRHVNQLKYFWLTLHCLSLYPTIPQIPLMMSHLFLLFCLTHRNHLPVSLLPCCQTLSLLPPYFTISSAFLCFPLPSQLTHYPATIFSPLLNTLDPTLPMCHLLLPPPLFPHLHPPIL